VNARTFFSNYVGQNAYSMTIVTEQPAPDYETEAVCEWCGDDFVAIVDGATQDVPAFCSRGCRSECAQDEYESRQS